MSTTPGTTTPTPPLRVQILASTTASLPKLLRPAQTLSDLLPNLLPGGWSDNSGIAPQTVAAGNIATAADWSRGPILGGLAGLGVLRFLADGTVQSGPQLNSGGENTRAGIYIVPREAPLDCRIGPNSGNVLGAGNPDQHFVATLGNWRTVPAFAAADAGGGTACANVGGTPLSIATTQATLPANRGFRLSLHTMNQTLDGSQPALRITWGGGFSVVLRHGMKATVQYLSAPLTGGLAGASPIWNTWRTFHELPESDLMNGRWHLTVWRLDGRLLVGLNGVLLWFLLPQPALSGALPTASSINEVGWPAAPLVASAWHVRVRVGMAVLKWSDPFGRPFTGALNRTVPGVTPPALGVGEAPGALCAGWQREGTSAAAAPNSDGTFGYTLTLQASPDGIASPFLDRVLLSYPAQWSTPDPTTLDLRPACTSLNIDQALPPLLAGAQATLELDRYLLDQTCPNWETHTAFGCPVRILVQHTGSAPAPVFEGQVFGTAKTSGGVGRRTLTLTLRDPIVRLQTPASVLDNRFIPLDWSFAARGQFAPGGYSKSGQYAGSPSLYIGEAIQEVVRQALGEAAADSVNGSGDPLRFMNPNPVPLFAPDHDAAGYALSPLPGAPRPLTSTQFHWPPPYGADAYIWMKNLAQLEHAVFFWGWPDGPLDGSGAPLPAVLCYGLPENFGAGTAPRLLQDADAGTGLLELLLEAQTANRPEADINRVLAWPAPRGALHSLLPALPSFEARLPPSDPRAAEQTYERTRVLLQPGLGAGSQAAPTAAMLIDRLTNLPQEWPTLTLRGDESWRPGTRFQIPGPGSYSDGTLNLNQLLFRVERLEHIINFQPTTEEVFTTRLHARPV